MEKNKKKIILGIFLVLIIIAVVSCLIYFFILKDSQEEPKILPSATVANKTSCLYSSFYHIMTNYNTEEIFQTKKFLFDDLNDISCDNSCGSSIELDSVNSLYRWEIDGNCTEENLTSSILSIEENKRLRILGMASDGAIIDASVQNDSTYNYHEISLINENQEFVWTTTLEDRESDNASIMIRDALETENGYYIIGYAKNTYSGDFTDVSNNYQEYNFLAKYDLKGNLQSIINLDSLTQTPLPVIYYLFEYSNNTLYMGSRTEIISLEKDTNLTLYDNIDSEITLFGKYSNGYYGVKNQTKTIDYTEIEASNIVLLNEEGQNKVVIDMSQYANCVDENCIVDNVYASKNNFMVQMNGVVYFFDENGSLLKERKYTQATIDGKIIENMQIADIIVKDDAYYFISFPDSNHIYIEGYDLNENSILEKNYNINNISYLYDMRENYDIKCDENGCFFGLELMNGFYSIILLNLKY